MTMYVINIDFYFKEKTGSYHRAVILVNATYICFADIRSISNDIYNVTCVFKTTQRATCVPETTVKTTSETSQGSSRRPLTTTSAATVPTASSKRTIITALSTRRRTLSFRKYL